MRTLVDCLGSSFSAVVGVDTAGRLSDVSAASGIGQGIDEAAMVLFYTSNGASLPKRSFKAGDEQD